MNPSFYQVSLFSSHLYTSYITITSPSLSHNIFPSWPWIFVVIFLTTFLNPSSHSKEGWTTTLHFFSLFYSLNKWFFHIVIVLSFFFLCVFIMWLWLLFLCLLVVRFGFRRVVRTFLLLCGRFGWANKFDHTQTITKMIDINMQQNCDSRVNLEKASSFNICARLIFSGLYFLAQQSPKCLNMCHKGKSRLFSNILSTFLNRGKLVYNLLHFLSNVAVYLD